MQQFFSAEGSCSSFSYSVFPANESETDGFQWFLVQKTGPRKKPKRIRFQKEFHLKKIYIYTVFLTIKCWSFGNEHRYCCSSRRMDENLQFQKRTKNWPTKYDPSCLNHVMDLTIILRLHRFFKRAELAPSFLF